MNIGDAVKRACKEPTLLDALTWICIWESERVVRQARQNEQWGTCFKICLKSVMDAFSMLGKEYREKEIAKPTCCNLICYAEKLQFEVRIKELEPDAFIKNDECIKEVGDEV